MKQSLYAAVAVAALCALSSSANAGVIVSLGTLTAPVVENFNSLSSPFASTTHSGGGVTETYVGTTSGGINTNFLSNTDLSWRPLLAQGFTEFTFDAPIEGFGFSAGHANNANTTLAFSLNGRVWNGATLLTTFSLAGLTYAQLQDYMITTTGSDLITRVDLGAYATVLGTTFQENGFDRSLVDGLRVAQKTQITPGSAPEPSTWALMILGFGGVGTMLRTRRRKAAIA